MNDAERSNVAPGRHRRNSFTKRNTRVLCVLVGVLLTAYMCWNILRNPDPKQLAAQGAKLVDRHPEEAERLLRQALEHSRDRLPETEVCLCLLLARKRDWNSALPLFARLDQNDCSDEFLLEFGKLAHRAGHVEKAIEALNVVRKRNSTGTYAALELLAQIHQAHREERELLDCVREMSLLTPGEPTLWWKLLELLDARQLTTQSITHLRLALRQDLPQRDQIEMRHRLISRLVGQGQIAEARAELNLLPRSEQLRPRAERHCAALFRLEGKPEQALASLKASNSMTTDQPGVAWLRGQIHFDLQQYDDAIRDFQTVLKADPFDLTVHLRLAEAYRATEQLERAEQHAESARSIRETRQQINRLREKVIHSPGDRSLSMELARLYRELHDQPAADYWEKRASDPGAGTKERSRNN